MIEVIRTYNTQFDFVPELVNGHLVRKNFKHIVLCGMGGSHLPAGIIKTIEPGVEIYVHRDYDLPPYDKNFLDSAILVASSYSGNTAEVVSFYKKIKQLYDLPVVCITKGGELLKLAQEHNDPYIVLPETDFVPRTALGYSVLAVSFLLKEKTIYNRIKEVALPIQDLEKRAQEVFEKIMSKTPIFYASNSNLHIAYNLKIKCNETAKMHAFYNVFPEFNHNELEAYEYQSQNSELLPIILSDSSDDLRLKKRFDAFKNILQEKGIDFLVLDISNPDICNKVFSAIVLGDFITAYIAHQKGVPVADVPLIEEFKKRII